MPYDRSGSVALTSGAVPRKSLSAYTHAHRHFYVDQVQPLLLETVTRNPRSTIADLGAGDGAILWALKRRGLLGDIAYAVDLSAQRVAHAEQVSPHIRGIVADATDVSVLPDQSVDGVIVSQVIEHLEDDRALAREIARLLRPSGWWYVGTVLRGRHAWWIYHVDGKWQLDPTHIREYASQADFVSALEHSELRIDEVRVTPLYFPVSDLVVRALAFAGLFQRDSLSEVYVGRPALSVARTVRVRVPGYWLLEGCGQKMVRSGFPPGA
jgi:2-polyprenyl-3-methyl-5-hydroxy-6-metoxy-1,4-benzoquinol methylase